MAYLGLACAGATSEGSVHGIVLRCVSLVATVPPVTVQLHCLTQEATVSSMNMDVFVLVEAWAKLLKALFAAYFPW